MRFVYIHGFNSAFDPHNEKVLALETVAPVLGITYNCFSSYTKIISSIEAQLHDISDLVFVGTSLGAFFAAEMGRLHSRPSVIINPCVNPFAMLLFAVDVPMKNFISGEVSSLSEICRNSYAKLELNTKARYKYKPLLLLDLDDELLSSKRTAKVLCDFPRRTWKGGCHRFSHIKEALDTIKLYVDKSDEC